MSTPISDTLEKHGARYYNNPRWHEKVFKQMRALETENGELADALEELEQWAHQWTDKDNGLLVKARAVLRKVGRVK